MTCRLDRRPRPREQLGQPGRRDEERGGQNREDRGADRPRHAEVDREREDRDARGADRRGERRGGLEPRADRVEERDEQRELTDLQRRPPGRGHERGPEDDDEQQAHHGVREENALAPPPFRRIEDRDRHRDAQERGERLGLRRDRRVPGGVERGDRRRDRHQEREGAVRIVKDRRAPGRGGAERIGDGRRRDDRHERPRDRLASGLRAERVDERDGHDRVPDRDRGPHQPRAAARRPGPRGEYEPARDDERERRERHVGSELHGRVRAGRGGDRRMGRPERAPRMLVPDRAPEARDREQERERDERRAVGRRPRAKVEEDRREPEQPQHRQRAADDARRARDRGDRASEQHLDGGEHEHAEPARRHERERLVGVGHALRHADHDAEPRAEREEDPVRPLDVCRCRVALDDGSEERNRRGEGEREREQERSARVERRVEHERCRVGRRDRGRDRRPRPRGVSGLARPLSCRAAQHEPRGQEQIGERHEQERPEPVIDPEIMLEQHDDEQRNDLNEESRDRVERDAQPGRGSGPPARDEGRGQGDLERQRAVGGLGGRDDGEVQPHEREQAAHRDARIPDPVARLLEVVREQSRGEGRGGEQRDEDRVGVDPRRSRDAQRIGDEEQGEWNERNRLAQASRGRRLDREGGEQERRSERREPPDLDAGRHRDRDDGGRDETDPREDERDRAERRPPERPVFERAAEEQRDEGDRAARDEPDARRHVPRQERERQAPERGAEPEVGVPHVAAPPRGVEIGMRGEQRDRDADRRRVAARVEVAERGKELGRDEARDAGVEEERERDPDVAAEEERLAELLPAAPLVDALGRQLRVQVGARDEPEHERVGARRGAARQLEGQQPARRERRRVRHIDEDAVAEPERDGQRHDEGHERDDPRVAAVLDQPGAQPEPWVERQQQRPEEEHTAPDEPLFGPTLRADDERDASGERGKGHETEQARLDDGALELEAQRVAQPHHDADGEQQRARVEHQPHGAEVDEHVEQRPPRRRGRRRRNRRSERRRLAGRRGRRRRGAVGDGRTDGVSRSQTSRSRGRPSHGNRGAEGRRLGGLRSRAGAAFGEHPDEGLSIALGLVGEPLGEIVGEIAPTAPLLDTELQVVERSDVADGAPVERESARAALGVAGERRPVADITS